MAMNLINLDIRMLRSLMSVVETGSITETARRLGRTQPAITLQLQRLEELTGKAIFIHEGRRLFLTAEGETVLSYARSIIGFHDEMLSQLASPDIEGHVVQDLLFPDEGVQPADGQDVHSGSPR